MANASGALADAVPGFGTVGSTVRYRISCFSDGLAYLILDRETGAEKLLTGSDAFVFHRAVQVLRLASVTPGAPGARWPIDESLDNLAADFCRTASP
jgi:hypothetical protein